MITVKPGYVRAEHLAYSLCVGETNLRKRYTFINELCVDVLFLLNRTPLTVTLSQI